MSSPNFPKSLVLILASLIASVMTPEAAAADWEWTAAAPESEGLVARRLDSLWSDLQARRSTALLVIRNDKIVFERYAGANNQNTKHYSASMAKALVGGVSLAVAMTDGRMALDDLASKYVPQWANDPARSKIKIRHLGSHTSGLADAEQNGLPHDKLTGWQGDFWKRMTPPNDPFTISRDTTPLLFEPGNNFQYSNPGLAMLGYAITSALKDAPQGDLRSLLRDRAMRPIGVPDSDWSIGYGQTVTIDGLPIVATWGGGNFTPRAVARVGRLMLRKGNWEGRQLIAASAVEAVTTDAGTPKNCGMGWWSNHDGTMEKLPQDAFWGAGAGHQVVLVAPSLKLIAVRNGEALNPAKTYDAALREHFLEPLVSAIGDKAKRETSGAPYPRSRVIKEIAWAPQETIIRKAKGSDNWPMTWADDDALYTAYGDGNGFEPFVPEKLSLGIAKITGSPGDWVGINLRSALIEQKGEGKAGQKASGILMVEGVLYLWVRNASNAQLVWSGDHGATWTWSDWKFTRSFGCPTFLNFGRNYEGARDGFVYVYSHDSDNAYDAADRFVLARVRKKQVPERPAYEFFARFDSNGKPVWTRDIDERGALFTRTGNCFRSGITYNAPLKRYLWCQILPTSNHPQGPRFQGGFGIYDAPEPWGPWTTVFYTEAWDVGPGETSSFPTKWMSDDGTTVHLVFSGDDFFSLRKATLAVNQGSASEGTASQRRVSPPPTRVSIADGRWQINGEATYRGAKAEGLLLNVRMVNATFEDRNRTDFDPEANADEFIGKISDYVAHGVRGFTLNLQGGTPGYEGAMNSAFNSDGSLRDSYMRRIRRVIAACDRNGAVVILGCFYQRQDQILKNEDAVRTGVVNAVKWIQAAGFRNVVLEIANEFGHGGFDHRILKSPEGQVELIQLAKRTVPELLVSTSGLGDGAAHESVARASDFLLVHFNSTRLEDIPRRLSALKKYGKPIGCNEDQKIGEDGAKAAESCVANGASWGLMLEKLNQHFPFTFKGAADDAVVYATLKRLAF